MEGSMEQLKKGLESGTVLIQFEVRDLEGHVLGLRVSHSGLSGLLSGCHVTPGTREPVLIVGTRWGFRA